MTTIREWAKVYGFCRYVASDENGNDVSFDTEVISIIFHTNERFAANTSIGRVDVERLITYR